MARMDGSLVGDMGRCKGSGINGKDWVRTEGTEMNK